MQTSLIDTHAHMQPAEDAPDPAGKTQPAGGVNAPQPALRYSKTRAVFAGLFYFAVYLGVRLVVDILFMLILALQSVLAAGITDVQAMLKDLLLRAQNGSLLLGAIVNAAVLLGIAVIFFARKMSVCREIGLKKAPPAALVPLVPLGICLNILLVAVFSLLPQAWVDAYAEASNALFADSLTPFAVFVIVILSPITEEVLFRGLLYTRFRRGLPAWAAVLLASGLFGVLHMQPLWMLYAACMGALFCLVMQRQGTLLAPILLHVSFNAGSFVTPLLQNLSPAPVLFVALGVCCVCGRLALTPRDKAAPAAEL